jgi:hypothetical protein
LRTGSSILETDEPVFSARPAAAPLTIALDADVPVTRYEFPL